MKSLVFLIGALMTISGAAMASAGGSAPITCQPGYEAYYAPLEHRYVCIFVGESNDDRGGHTH
jgi:hypothetical protein